MAIVVRTLTSLPTRVPQLFKEIMRNHRELEAAVLAPVINMSETGRLLRERRDYRRGAEEMLHWNKDKGDAAR